jgi:hypothetical protein
VCEICHDGIQASFHVARGFPFDLNVDRRERLSIEHSRASRVSGWAVTLFVRKPWIITTPNASPPIGY